jgi:DNA (cytosine-5)-methyltransferase 1
VSKKSYVTVTDQFCGAGGSSLGATRAGAEVVLAMNHWKLAIQTHNTNFPQTYHECTDISACDPRRYPSTDILITSPECTAHTLAKGKKRRQMAQMDLWGKNGIDPAEERSRATMWDVPRFAEHHAYSIVIVENVVDAALYWPLFDTWLQAMHVLGYDHELVCFNSMFAHPTPQSRDRLYVVFWRRGNKKPDLSFTPRAWCLRCGHDVASVQSWKDPRRRRVGKYGPTHGQYVYRCPECTSVVQPYYYCAANAIDWSMQGERIGDRARPLKERTLERIRYGLAKFAGCPVVIGLSHTHGAAQRAYAATDPWPTQTGQQDKTLLVPPFLMGIHGEYYTYRGLDQEIPTCVGSASTTAMVVPPFLTSVNYFSERPRGLDEPFPTQTTKQPYALTVPPFIVEEKQHHNGKPLTDPLGTVIAGGNHHYLVAPPPFLIGQQSGAVARDVREAGPTVAGAGGISLIVPAGGTWADAATEAHEPYPTQTARETHGVAFAPPHMLVPYYGTSQAHGVEEPARAVTTHDREALCSVAPAVEDCRFRMLQPHEIQAAMAFPGAYTVLGTSREKVKQLGNAVTPPIMDMLLERCIATLAG